MGRRSALLAPILVDYPGNDIAFDSLIHLERLLAFYGCPLS